MQLKEIIFSILAILLIFFTFEAGKNKIKAEKSEEKIIQKDEAIKNEKSINETKTKQQKIIINTNVDSEYRTKWVSWLREGGAGSSK